MHSQILSIVTVTFNAQVAFQKTLASVQSQTVRQRLEYLVVDGASTDGTPEAIREAADRGDVDTWISEHDRGIYDAMNKGVSLARGEYVLFLNAGDTFPEPTTVERFLDWGGSNPDFVWGDCEINRNGTLVPDPASRMPRFLYRQMTVSHQSLAVRTDLLRTHPFDLSLKVAADYELLCSLVTEGYCGLYRPITVSQTMDEGFSSRNFWIGLDEKRKVSRRFFPREQWRAVPYFWLWGIYMRFKFRLKEKS